MGIVHVIIPSQEAQDDLKVAQQVVSAYGRKTPGESKDKQPKDKYAVKIEAT